MTPTPPSLTAAEVLAAKAFHPQAGRMQFEQVTQGGKVYYRLLMDDKQIGVLVPLERAANIVRFWMAQGWIAK
jgi:hypothetical protein